MRLEEKDSICIQCESLLEIVIINYYLPFTQMNNIFTSIHFSTISNFISLVTVEVPTEISV